jgi:hypothetical protein
MNDILFWLYFTNTVILISHEIDSAYWQEWELFKLPGGIQLFVLLHIPMISIILYGLILVNNQSYFGLFYSLVLSSIGIFAFSIHSYFLIKGNDKFNNFASKLLLLATLLVSIVQLVVTTIKLLNS